MSNSTFLWIIAAIVALIVLTPGGRQTLASFLRNPNQEVAKAADGVKNPGFREIVAQSARGDYHRETAESDTAIAARAKAQSDIAIAMIHSHNQAHAEVMAAIANGYSPASKPSPQVIVLKEAVNAPADKKDGGKDAAEAAVKAAGTAKK